MNSPHRTQNPEPRTQNAEPSPWLANPGASPANAERQDAACGRILAGIPCYNTASHIADVVARTIPFVDEVVVVDDGSTDNTGTLSRQAGATVLTHPRNMGYGAAIRSCFDYAASRGAGILVTVDGDGQHYPEDIPSLLDAFKLEGAAVVAGSRFLGGDGEHPQVNVPRYRAFGIRVITTLFNFASGCRVTDAQCGLRAYSARAVRELMPASPGMDVSVELLVTARARGLRIVEVPVGCVYHDDGSTLHPVPHGIRVALAVVLLRSGAILRRWRRKVWRTPDTSPMASLIHEDDQGRLTAAGARQGERR